MLNKSEEKRNQIQMFCIEDLVPKDHMLRKIERAIDWNFIYELVEEKYSLDNGRQCIKHGLVKPKEVFVDATHVKACANNKKITTEIVKQEALFYEEQLEKEINFDRKKHGIKPLLPYKRPQTKKGYFKKYDYAYDEYFDCYICPNNKILKYSTTNREGYREYKSCPQDCEKCPYLSQCTESQNHTKVVTQHIWDDYLEICEDIRCTRGNKELYKKRKETIERLFGTAKEHHGFRYTQMVGKAKMEMKVGLTFACLNLKKLAKILDKRQGYADLLLDLFDILLNFLYFNPQKEKSRFSLA
jgi:hypothetical protein